jgi:hypothetical protein
MVYLFFNSDGKERFEIEKPQAKQFFDLGDITTSRGTESLLPVWLRIFGATQNGFFNFKVATGK